MSTNSFIGVRNLDGSITGIYCHWDGYPQYVGDLLFNHYQSRKDALELISLGDISSLDVCTSATTAYARDRGEPWGYVAPRNYSDLETIVKDSSYEYAYVWEEGQGWCFCEVVWGGVGEGNYPDNYRRLLESDIS